MKGEIVSFQLFDVGGTLDLATLQRQLARDQPRRGQTIGKGTPPYVEFPQPLSVSRGPVPIEAPWGGGTSEVTVLYYPIGAVSVRFRIPFDVDSLADLGPWSRLRASVAGAGPEALDAAARRLLEADRKNWGTGLGDRYTENVITESYTVFAFQDVGEPTHEFFKHRRREIAGLLKGEPGDRLHDFEVDEALKRWFSYYNDDFIVIDWDAALLVDASPEYEDLLLVLEIANLQLLEFRAYDDYLDDAIAHSYDELQGLYRRRNLFRTARRTVHELSVVRMEIAELADEADNITKFLGDWFLARVYQAAQDRFHLADWRATVDEKLATIHNLYQLANAEGDTRRLVVLEVLIVLLFILDLAILVFK